MGVGPLSNVTDAAIVATMNLSRQQELYITNDLANYDTPGFKAQNLSFQGQLAKALGQGPSAVAQVAGTVVTTPGSVGNNGNSVSMTSEMADLARSQLLYETAVQAYNQKTTEIKIVTEGKAQ
ncbi:flagellar basal body rod protein FlgB [Sulfobacillus harzensis]|uniref:Flagellar basal body rod protein n=1 Tax=Sulfobacillus harzensis TaxID=2729629 RepID=A0A7Y0L7W7_9FIRM|nr:flagellar basal body rod protein [Sulfobacillus harzensis]NMP23544.1 flagellar basal body rod protein [Sulfobacillus harzensis]